MRVKAIIFMLAGTIFVLCANLTVSGTITFIRTAIAAPGHITASGPGGVHPEVEFVTKKGEKISYIQNSVKKYVSGQHVTVLYRPESPWDRPVIDDYLTIWGGPGSLFLMGIGFFLIGWLDYPSKNK